MTETQENHERLAYLLGAIYGDGCFSKSDGRGRIHFGSADLDFAKSVAATIRQLFSIAVNIRCIKLSEKNPEHRDFYALSSRPLYRLLQQYELSRDAKLPGFITSGEVNIKSAFIRGFFDAEASVHVSVLKSRNELQRRIQCTQKNTALLEQIKEMLSAQGIKSAIFKGNKAHILSIWSYDGLVRYRKIIGFSMKRKSKKLDEVIASYKEIQTRWNIEAYRTVMKLRERNIGARKIKRILSESGLSIPQPTIESWIYNRAEIRR